MSISIVSGGFDGGCEAGFYGVWDMLLQPLFFARLERAKTARDGGNAALSYVVFGGHVWHVSPSGARVGGVYYAYVVECHGVKLYIHANPQGEVQPVRVRFGADCLYFCNLFSAVRYLYRVFAAVGFKVTRDVVSRVDCQVTFSGVTVADFYMDFSRSGCLVTRAVGGCDVRNNLRTGQLETITLASSSIELCIYDKRAQVATLDDAAYRAFMWGGLRGGLLPRRLTRVEFRFRRDALRRYGIDSFEDLQKSVVSLLDLAATDWVRVLERPKTLGNTGKIPVSWLWSVVQRAFSCVFADSAVSVRPVVRRVNVPSRSLDSLFATAVGVLARAASLQLPLVNGVDDIYDFFDDFFKVHGEKIYRRCRDMQLESAVTRGYSAGSGAVSDGFCEDVAEEGPPCV